VTKKIYRFYSFDRTFFAAFGTTEIDVQLRGSCIAKLLNIGTWGVGAKPQQTTSPAPRAGVRGWVKCPNIKSFYYKVISRLFLSLGTVAPTTTLLYVMSKLWGLLYFLKQCF
jgi:hypothetical protein